MEQSTGFRTELPAHAHAGHGEEAESAILRDVFWWMTAGLLTTAVVSYCTLQSETLLRLVLNRTTMLFLSLGMLAYVWIFSSKLRSLSAEAAIAGFLFYAVMMGVFLGPIGLIYSGASIATSFVITAGTFGIMATYGSVTKRSLDGLGSFCMMGLIGLLLATLVNIFMQNSMVNFLVSCAGVIVFTGLTAYDVKKIRENALEAKAEGDNSWRRLAIIGALSLYLDFVNLFLYMLRLLGDRR